MDPKERQKYILEGMKVVETVFSLFVYKHKLYIFMSKDDLEDLKQDCMVEMIHTVDRFDPERKIKLTTFISPRIDGFLKDFVKKQTKENKLIDMNKVLYSISLKIDKVLKSDTEHATLDIEKLENSGTTIEEIVLDMGCHPDTYEILDSLVELPETRMKVILGYYVLDKTIKELSDELGFSPDTGWVYKLRNEGIRTLKSLLKEKGLL